MSAAKSDSEHANAIKQAADALEEAIRDAYRDGVRVKLHIGAGSGLERSRDKITQFPIVQPEIFRPLLPERPHP